MLQVVILIGAPGAGKGTLAAGLTAKLGLEHVSTGDILRAAVKDGSDIGQSAESYMEAGELVPDDLIMRVVNERLDAASNGDGYMFDGFPRNVRQAELFEETLKERGSEVSCVLGLDVDRGLLIGRLTGRRICRDCGASYHVINIPPKAEGVCDKCGGELYQRVDDSEETIANRLDVFESQTRGLMGYYGPLGKVINIPAGGRAEETEQAVLDALSKV